MGPIERLCLCVMLPSFAALTNFNSWCQEGPEWMTSVPFRTFNLYFLNVTILNDFF